VPVADIVETLYELVIVCEPISEPPGETILGALSPQDKTIHLNERHLAFFDAWVGPETFTLAHELGHWVYDAVDPNQGQLFDDSFVSVFCRHGDDGNHDSDDIREVNANKFASCLVLPSDVIKAAVAAPFPTWSDLGASASAWGVSKTTLRIRLETLGMGWAIP
jgi:Zn-dependent peptidase ImmA (M78 family)